MAEPRNAETSAPEHTCETPRMGGWVCEACAFEAGAASRQGEVEDYRLSCLHFDELIVRVVEEDARLREKLRQALDAHGAAKELVCFRREDLESMVEGR